MRFFAPYPALAIERRRGARIHGLSFALTCASFASLRAHTHNLTVSPELGKMEEEDSHSGRERCAHSEGSCGMPAPHAHCSGSPNALAATRSLLVDAQSARGSSFALSRLLLALIAHASMPRQLRLRADFISLISAPRPDSSRPSSLVRGLRWKAGLWTGFGLKPFVTVDAGGGDRGGEGGRRCVHAVKGKAESTLLGGNKLGAGG